jgi:P pilus assembly chaperone PapD
VTVTVAPTAWDDPDVTRLTAAQQHELRARHDGAGAPDAAESLFYERVLAP